MRQRIDKLGSVGLNSDVQPYLLPPQAWTRMENCVTQDGELRSVQGEVKLFDLDIPPTYHVAYTDPLTGTPYVVVSDGTQVWAYNVKLGTGVNITPVSGNWGGDLVTFTALNGVLVANSRSDGPFYWADRATGVLIPLPGWDPTWRCRQIVAYRYYLVALNMTEGAALYPHKVRWSNSAQEGSVPAVWVAAASNDAGADLIGESPGPIVGGALVRDALFVVKEDSVHSMNWVGGQFVMQLSRLKGDIGTRLQKGFAEMRGGLVLFSTSDIQWFDGQESRSLADQRVRGAIFSAISPELWDLSEVYVHSPSSRLIIAGVSSGYRRQSIAIVYNWEEDTWSRHNLHYGYGFDSSLVEVDANTLTWDELELPGPSTSWLPGEPWDAQGVNNTWDTGVYNPSVPDLLIYQSTPDDSTWWISVQALASTNFDGSPKSCLAERVALPIEGADGLAMVTELWPEARGTASLIRVSVGSQIAANGEVTWDGPHDVVPNLQQSITPRITGRYIALRVQSLDSGSWSLGSVTFDWQRAGER